MGSNLLYKASIVTTPTAYGVGVLNSIKPAYALGENLVTNGDFATDSDWTKGTGWTISGGKANCDGSQSSQSNLYQTGIVPINKTYKVTFTIVVTSGNMVLAIGGSNAQPTVSSSGTYTFTSKAAFGDSNLYFSASSVFVGSIDNVSVKEITDADFDFTRTSSATRVNPDYLIETVSINSANLVQNGNFSELGSQLVVNGDFETDSNWTKGAGWSISNGKAVSNSSTSSIFQSTGSNYTSGKTYKIVFTVSDYVSGSVRPEITNIAGNNVSSNGTFTQYIVATSSPIGEELKAVNFVGSIDNVSVKQVDPNNNWSLATGWSISGGKANANTTGNFVNLTQNNIFEVGKTYITKFTITAYTQGSIRLTQAGLDVSGSKSALGTYTTTYKAVSVGSEDQLIMQGLNSFVGSITDISIIEIQENGVPRLDYTNGTASILLEPQGTNLLPYSEDFSNSSWTKQRATVSSNTTTSPDGTITADTLIESTDNNTHQIYDDIVCSSGVAYTFSVFAKAKERSFIYVREFTSGAGAYFNISTGVLGTADVAVDSYGIEDMGNGWYRCWIVVTKGDTNFRAFLMPAIADLTSVYQGDGTSGVYIWGAQLEEQSFATSYIPTSGSTVTRATETLNNAGNSDLINSTEGVLYAEIAALSDDLTYRLLAIEDSSDANNTFIYLGYKDSSNTIRARLEVGGVASANMEFVLPNETQFNKIAVKWKQNDFALWVDGVEVATDSSGSSFNANILDRLSFNRNSNLEFFGKCKTVAVFKEALSDTELACLTSTNNREIFLNYYYRMQYVGANTEALNCAEQTFNV